MNILSPLSASLLLVLPAAAQSPAASEDSTSPPASAPASEETGFTALFDADSLAGWRGRPFDNAYGGTGKSEEELVAARAAANESRDAHWTNSGGVIAFDGAGGSIETDRDYADFELRLDWKIEAGGDSGLYLRGIPQIQFWDPANEGQRQHGNQHGSGGLWNNPQDQGKFPAVVADRPVGEWNELRVRMVGSTVSVWLNGQLIVDQQELLNNWDRNQPLPDQGPLVLQAHGHKVWFRNVRVREL